MKHKVVQKQKNYIRVANDQGGDFRVMRSRC